MIDLLMRGGGINDLCFSLLRYGDYWLKTVPFEEKKRLMSSERKF
jgi:hypothetical protein